MCERCNKSCMHDEEMLFCVAGFSAETMTGSESPNSVSKGSRPPKVQGQQQQRETSGKDQLRRLAIKNSFGNKSLSPTSPLSKALSSSTSNLHHLTPVYPLKGPAEVHEETGCKLQGLAIQDKEESRRQLNNKYITRQELLHSLRRTSSNHSVGLTQTICSGNSSYIHHTPRHLMRTHFSPKTYSATVTPDSGIWSSDDVSISGEKVTDDREGCDAVHETQSLVGMSPTNSHSRSSPMVTPRKSKQRQRRPLYVGVEVMDSPSKKYQHHQVLEKADRNKVTLEISPSRNCPENELEVGSSMDGLSSAVPGLPGTLPSKNRQRIPQHQGSVSSYSSTQYQGDYQTATLPVIGSNRVSPRHLTDKKIKLHIPQGRKTASLV